MSKQKDIMKEFEYLHDVDNPKGEQFAIEHGSCAYHHVKVALQQARTEAIKEYVKGLNLNAWADLSKHNQRVLDKLLDYREDATRTQTIQDIESCNLNKCDCCFKVKGGQFICGTCADCI